MQLGIFAKIFDRPNVSSCLQAVAGIPATQFNLSVAGLPTIPDEPVPDDVVDAIRASANQAVWHLPRSPAPSTPPTPTRHTGRPNWPGPRTCA